MDRQRKELVELGSYLVRHGYARGSVGNLSARLENGNFLASPTNSHLGALVEDKLSLISPKGELLQGAKPSKEVPLHLAVYRQSAQTNYIIHLHSTYLTALSCLVKLDPDNVFRAFTPYVVMKVGKLPLVPYFRPGSPRIAEAIEKLASSHSAFLLANHGIVVAGPSLWDACYRFEELEETAKLRFLLRGEDVRYLSESEVIELGQS